MKLTINGNQEDLMLKENNVYELLSIMKVKMPETVSVEINGNILKRKEFETRALEENDIIEFLYYMSGGCYENIRS